MFEGSEEGLLVVFGRVFREKTVSDSVRQPSVGLSKIIILVEDHSGSVIRMWRLESLALKRG